MAISVIHYTVFMVLYPLNIKNKFPFDKYAWPNAPIYHSEFPPISIYGRFSKCV